MGDRGPSKRITMADFLFPTQQQQQKNTPTATNHNKNTNENTTTTVSNNNQTTQFSNASSASPPPPPRLYTIRATKKGGVPCVVEKRKHHKVVVLSNVEGDVAALLSALQKSLGTGGAVGRGGTSIEIQGDQHLEKVKRFCLNSGCVLGANQADVQAAGGKNKSESKSTVNIVAKPLADVAPLLMKEIKTMKPSQLKEHLAARQLSTQGNKKELLERLTISVRGT